MLYSLLASRALPQIQLFVGFFFLKCPPALVLEGQISWLYSQKEQGFLCDVNSSSPGKMEATLPLRSDLRAVEGLVVIISCVPWWTFTFYKKTHPTELIFSIGKIWADFYSSIIIYQPLSCSPLLAGCSKSTQLTREQWTEIFSRADGVYLQKPGLSHWNWDIWQT